MHAFWYGILMGWGAAIPFGPINLEISRRNLQQGTPHGLALGLGACFADVTYLLLLGLGALPFIQQPAILRIIGAIGAGILGWFGIMAIRHKTAKSHQQLKKRSLWCDFTSGYFLTLFNPYTIIFWFSILSQVAILSNAENPAIFSTGAGVLLGAFSWVLFLNFFLHFTRHKIPQKLTNSLGILGGTILIGFATFGIIKAIIW